MPKKELPIIGRFMLRLLYVLVLALLGCCAFLFYKFKGYDTSIDDLQKTTRDSKSELSRCERALEGMKAEQKKEETSRAMELSQLHAALGYEADKANYADLTGLSKQVADQTAKINEQALNPPMAACDVNVKTLLVALSAQFNRMKEAQAEAWEKAKAEQKAMAEAHAEAAKRADAEAEARAKAEEQAMAEAQAMREALAEAVERTAAMEKILEEKKLEIENLKAELDKKQ
ncbi:MAG: hypothetical protein ACYS47_19020 [Planctomycetota bacterium]|jgi:paraquat-inducible protein B